MLRFNKKESKILELKINDDHFNNNDGNNWADFNKVFPDCGSNNEVEKITIDTFDKSKDNNYKDDGWANFDT